MYNEKGLKCEKKYVSKKKLKQHIARKHRKSTSQNTNTCTSSNEMMETESCNKTNPTTPDLSSETIHSSSEDPSTNNGSFHGLPLITSTFSAVEHPNLLSALSSLPRPSVSAANNSKTIQNVQTYCVTKESLQYLQTVLQSKNSSPALNIHDEFPPRLEQIAKIRQKLDQVDNSLKMIGGLHQIEIQKNNLELISMTIQQMKINQTVVSADREEIKKIEAYHEQLKIKIETILKDISLLDSSSQTAIPYTTEDEDELQNLSEKEMRTGLNIIYADEEVEKLDTPFIIYLHRGITRREPISKNDYNAFMKFLIRKSCDERNIAWHGFGLSCRCIIG